MDISELTHEMVTPVIEAVVAEYGIDYVYNPETTGQCLYHENGKPSCIVGHVLDRLGVEYNDSWESVGARSVLATAPRTVCSSLAAAQDEQDMYDTGHTWGDALQEYHETLAFELQVERTKNAKLASNALLS